MIRVKHETSIDLSMDEAVKLLRQVIMTDFDELCKDINELRRNPDIKAFQAQDLVDELEVRDAMLRVLRYYMKHDDFVEFMELQRTYGNV